MHEKAANGRFMGEGAAAFLKRLCCLALLLSGFLHAAEAAFSPGLAAAAAGQADGTREIRLSAQLEYWNRLMPKSLAALQGWLTDAALMLHQGEDAWSFDLRHADSSLLSASQEWSGDTQLLRVTDRAYSLPLGQDGWSLLGLGDSTPLRFPENPFRALTGFLPGWGSVLSAWETSLRQSTSIKNVGTARETRTYSLEAETWQDRWPLLLKSLPGALQEALAGLRFQDKGTLKRYLDADGRDLGFQFRGSVSLPDGEAFSITLFAGHARDKGLYLSLRAPAIKGRKPLLLQISGRQNADKAGSRLDADWRYEWPENANRSARGSGVLKLRSTPGESTETLRGSLRADHQPAAAGSARLRLRLEPELQPEGGRVKGSLSVSLQEGTAEALKMRFFLEDAPAQKRAAIPTYTVPLAELSPELLAAQRDAVLQSLVNALRAELMRLPEDARLALIHDMGRNARAQGESMPPLGENLPDTAQWNETPAFAIVDEPTLEEVDP